MNDRLFELISELEKIGMEQISEMMIASLRNDKKQVLIDGISFPDNIHYAQKDFFYTKRKTKQEEFYVRSDGDENTNLLLYSHMKEIIEDGSAGVFSVGSAFSNKREEIMLCICQIIDYSRLGQVQDVFHRYGISFRKFENNHFATKSTILFSNI